MTERSAQRLRRGLLLVALLGLALGAVALRIAAILGGRLDPDLVTTEAATLATTVAWAVLAAMAVAVAGLWVAWRRAPRTAPPWPVPGGPSILHGMTGAVTLALAAGSVLLVAAGSVGALVVDGRDGARAAWQTLAAGAFLVLPTAALFGWAVGEAAWRAANLGSDGSPTQPFPPDRERRWPFVAIALLAIVGVAPPALSVDAQRERPCPAGLDCRWMTVQLDQASDDPRGATTPLRYDLWRATGTRRGTFVVATGGPGVAGTAAYGQIERWFDPRLTASFDIVLFDSRGVGGSGYRDCPIASQRYADELSFDAPGTVITQFVDGCIVEADVDPWDLGAYSSAQVAEDIETIRLDLGVERIVLYGESYGTVAAQHYAAAHPDRLEALILDGALDAVQSTDETWAEATRSFQAVLRRTLLACRDEVGCVDDPERAWERMIERLAGGPTTAAYADGDGRMASWSFDLDAAIDVLTDALYDQTGRMLALRALTAADAGDWVPLARMVYAGGPDGGALNEAVSDFAYYAAWCADRVAERPELDARTFLERARRSGIGRDPVGNVYLSAAACHAWPVPAGPAPELPRPGVRLDFPVVLLAASADPITPSIHARRLEARYRKVADTYLIETRDGPHVTLGRGNDCPDDQVMDLLLSGRRPEREVTCDGFLVDAMVALADDGSDLDPLRARARAFDIELMTHPDYLAWDGGWVLSIGCRYGGRVSVSSGPSSDRFDVDACEIRRGEPMEGSGTYHHGGSVELDLRFDRGSVVYTADGSFRYTSEATGTVTWEGAFDGRTREGFADAR